jgi:5-methylthioribose kinase
MRVTAIAAFAAAQVLRDYLISGGNLPGIDDDDVGEFLDALLKSKTIDVGEDDADPSTDS